MNVKKLDNIVIAHLITFISLLIFCIYLHNYKNEKTYFEKFIFYLIVIGKIFKDMLYNGMLLYTTMFFLNMTTNYEIIDYILITKYPRLLKILKFFCSYKL